MNIEPEMKVKLNYQYHLFFVELYDLFEDCPFVLWNKKLKEK